MSPAPLRFERVTRWYGPVAGVLEVSFTLEPGVTGLLGPNGAGKSTILHLAAGLIRPGMGRVEVFGRPPFLSGSARARLGLLPETQSFPPGVTGRTFLRTCLLLSGVPGREARRRADALLEEVGLARAADRKAAGYSQGMKQRLKLAQALGHDPDLLLLDEPLTGLDPLARREVIAKVHELGERGKAILVSSHVLHEVEAMTSRVILLNQGRILAWGEIPEIRALLKDQPIRVLVRGRDSRRLASEMARWPSVGGFRLNGDSLEVEAWDGEAFFEALGGLGRSDWAGLEEVRILDENLEALFDYLVG